jgi:Spy/CpxP family protein refolding chaperone
MFKHFLSASLVAASLAAPSFAASETPAKPKTRHEAGHQPRSPERFVQRLEKDLKLTPEQTVKVREILAQATPAAGTKGTGKEGRMARGPLPLGPEFAAQMRAEKVDTAALDREWKARSAKRQEGFVKMRDKFVALHAVLTPPQRALLAERMEKRGRGMHPGKDTPQDKRG